MLLLGLTGGFEPMARLCLGFQTPNMFPYLLIAFDDLLLVMIKRLQRLLQREQVFCSVIAFKGLANCCVIRVSPFVSHVCQFLAIPLSADNRANDPYPRQTCYVGYDVMALQIHLRH